MIPSVPVQRTPPGSSAGAQSPGGSTAPDAAAAAAQRLQAARASATPPRPAVQPTLRERLCQWLSNVFRRGARPVEAQRPAAASGDVLRGACDRMVEVTLESGAGRPPVAAWRALCAAARAHAESTGRTASDCARAAVSEALSRRALPQQVEFAHAFHKSLLIHLEPTDRPPQQEDLSLALDACVHCTRALTTPEQVMAANLQAMQGATFGYVPLRAGDPATASQAFNRQMWREAIHSRYVGVSDTGLRLALPSLRDPSAYVPGDAELEALTGFTDHVASGDLGRMNAIAAYAHQGLLAAALKCCEGIDSPLRLGGRPIAIIGASGQSEYTIIDNGDGTHDIRARQVVTVLQPHRHVARYQDDGADVFLAPGSHITIELTVRVDADGSARCTVLPAFKAYLPMEGTLELPRIA